MKYFILIIVLIIFSKNVNSNNLFDSPFYKIDFTSNNIDNDKIIEIRKIKFKSILSILKNTLNNDDYIKVSKDISEDLINTFIKNIVINDEKIINDRYLSKIKINYNKKKIIEYFRFNKISYVEYHPNKFLLIIHEIGQINNNLFSKNNNYYKYLIKNTNKNKFFQIPNLDINDRYILKEEDIINRDISKINKFTKKYNSNENIIVITKNNKNNIHYTLILYSHEKILEKKLLLNNNETDLFIKELEIETLNLWKQMNQIQNKSTNSFKCKVDYFNLLELKEIRKNLSKVSLIDNLNVKLLSYKNIEYDMHYFGNIKILFKIFELNKLKINFNDDECIIKLI